MKRKISVSRLVLYPFIAFLALTLLAFVAIGVVQTVLVSDFMHSQLAQKLTVVGTTLSKKQTDMKYIVELLATDDAIFYEAVENGDNYAIGTHLDNLMKLSNSLGYIFVNGNGEVTSSSYTDIDYDALAELVDHIGRGGKLNGCGKFLQSGICEFAASTVVDGWGSNIGYVIFVGFSTTDKDILANHKGMMGVDMVVFEDRQCVSTTIENITLDAIEPPLSMIDSCIVAQQPWMGMANFGGEQYYATAVPLIDYNGITKGMVGLCQAESVMSSITSPLTKISVAVSVILVILFIIVIAIIRISIVRPIRKLSDEVGVIATGDLTAKIDIPKAGDEIVLLAGSIADMETKMKDVLKPVVTMSKTIIQSIAKLSEASTQMSNGASRQAAALEEISSSMEQMSANIQQNTDNSFHTNKLAENISQHIGSLGDASGKSRDAVRSIAENLSEINELVQQTNILSLNASVEAARAGEQGKGFAVVAKEVGRLADQTYTTAAGINSTASTSITEAENAYNNVNELLPKIEKVVTLIKEITAASVEQNAGVSQVNSAIVDLNHVTQESAANAEEIAASAQELHRLLKEVSDAVAIFKV